jgi:hypothetical protein
MRGTMTPAGSLMEASVEEFHRKGMPMASINKGPATTSTPNTTLLLGSPGSGSSLGTFSSAVTATVAASVDNYSPPGVLPGISNLWFMTASPSTINGISTAGMAVGFSFLFLNQSATNSFSFAHLASTSLPQNQFSCPQGVTAELGPLTATIIVFDGINLVFGS